MGYNPFEHRRDFLRTAGIITGSVILTACAPGVSYGITQEPVTTRTPREQNEALLSDSRYWEQGESLYIQLNALDDLDEVDIFPKGDFHHADNYILYGYPPLAAIYGRNSEGVEVHQGIAGFENTEQFIFEGLMSEAATPLTQEALIRFGRGARMTVQYNPANILFTDGYTEAPSKDPGQYWSGPDWRVDPIIRFTDARIVSLDIPRTIVNPTGQSFKLDKLFQTISVHSNDTIEILR